MMLQLCTLPLSRSVISEVACVDKLAILFLHQIFML